MTTLHAQRRPCANCPWRRDARPGEFPEERYLKLTDTAVDMAVPVFACHKSLDGAELVCAGFLARGADHNFTVRMAYAFGDLEPIDRSGGLDLYEGYTDMAVANGVDPDDPMLRRCRS